MKSWQLTFSAAAALLLAGWWLAEPSLPSGHGSATPNGKEPVKFPQDSESAQRASTPHAPAKAHPAGQAVEVPLEVSAFKQWLNTRATIAADALNSVDLALAVQLASARRPVMREWLLRDPEAALKEAVGFAQYASLPEPVRAEVEEPFSVQAEWEVYPDCSGGGPNHHGVREGTLTKGRDWRTTAFGWRLGVTAKENSPMQGVRLDDVAAVHPEVFQPVSGADLAEVSKRFRVASANLMRSFGSKRKLGPDRIAAVAGGRLFWFADAADLALAESKAREMELMVGPQTGAQQIMEAVDADIAKTNAEPTWEKMMAASFVEASTWTETPKSVLCIVVDFPDEPGAYFDVNELTNIFNTEAKASFEAMSYGKTTINATASPVPVFRMPQPFTYYDPDRGSELHVDGVNAAAAAGIDIDSYDIWVVAYGSSSPGSGGVATVGGRRIRLRNSYTAQLPAHELGHTYGLGHALFWTSSDGNPTGGGTSEDEGDQFDRMGSGPIPRSHFHSQAKLKLNWLTNSDIAFVTSSATHRLYPLDNPDTTTGIRGIRIQRGVNDFLWVGFRQQFVEFPTLRNGVYVNWQQSGTTSCNLIDTTQGTSEGMDDAGVLIGRTFSDIGTNLHITPIAQGGNGAEEFIDVRINIGPFPGNQPPTANINGPTQVPARTTVAYSAEASDGNNDELAYQWDFGDSKVRGNAAAVDKKWLIGGTYTASVTVSDMKGGTVEKVQQVEVADEAFTWSNRSSGTPNSLNGIAASPDLVVAVGSNSGTVVRSTNGVAWTRNSIGPSGVVLNAVCWTGSVFIAVGHEGGTGIIYTSPDGVTWTLRMKQGAIVSHVATDGSSHVAVGTSGSIWRSTSADASVWTTIVVPEAASLRRVVYNGAAFLTAGTPVAGSTAKIWRSLDGNTWIRINDEATSSEINSPADLAWLNGRLYVTTATLGFYYSDDAGVTWNEITIGPSRITFTLFGNGIYYAANAFDPDQDMVSVDGVEWGTRPTGSSNTFNAGIFFKSTFITVGTSGSIRQGGLVPARPEDLPAIQAEPEGLLANLGTPASFTISATSSSGPLTYQWRKGGTPLPGNTAATLAFAAVQLGDEGSYDVILTNNSGSKTSAAVILTVSAPPVITQHPTDRTINEAQSTTFQVAATGRAPLSYQWQKDEQDIPGETGASLTISNASAPHVGSYRAVVTNSDGTKTSNPASLLVSAKPVFSEPAVSALVAKGASYTFAPAVVSALPVTYQWFKNGVTIPNAKSSAYTLTNIQLTHAATYRAFATNTIGTTVGPESQLSAVDVKAPLTLPIKPGSKTTLSIATASNLALTHTWRKNGTPITAGGRFQLGEKSLTITELVGADSGTYDCRVANAAGQSIIGAVTTLLVIDEKPTITSIAMPPGMVGVPYEFQIECAPGLNRTPASYSATGLPAGLKLNATTGLINGTPTAPTKPGALIMITARNLAGTHEITLPLSIAPLPEKVVGTFIGAIPRDATLNNALGGRLEITSTATGILSGKLFLGAKTIAFSGGRLLPTLNNPLVNGVATIKRTGAANVALTLVFDSDQGTFTGELNTFGLANPIPLNGWWNPWHATLRPATAHGGRHSFGLRPAALANGDESHPRGYGYGSFTIAKTGIITLSGKLADGSSLTGGGFPSAAGDLLIWQVLYNGGGSVLGTALITPGGAAPNFPDSTLAGTISWLRLPSNATPARTYTNGFPLFDLALFGGKYAAPTAGQVAMGLPNQENNARIRFTGGGLTHSTDTQPDLLLSLLNPASKGTTTTVKLPAVNPAKVRLTLTAATGTFSGGFFLPGTTSALNRNPVFQGQVVRSASEYTACGYFLLPQIPTAGQTLMTSPILSGVVEIVPAGP